MKYLRVIGCAILLLLSGNILAEIVSIGDPRHNPPNNEQGVPRPIRTMTMDEVIERFGAPLKKYKAVGNPPITRWKYEQFTVHFEYDRVIRSVVGVNKKP